MTDRPLTAPRARPPRWRLLVLLPALAALAACEMAPGARSAHVTSSTQGATAADSLRRPAAAERSAALPETTGEADAQDRGLEADADRLLTRAASLTIAVPRPADAIERFTALVEDAGGYLQRREDHTLTARVPADDFRELVAAVRALGRVTSEALEVDDVTEQHRDLSIRLANARESRERLLALLEDAEQVEDVLQIERELQRLTTEIERLTAQLEHLDLRIAMSLLQVRFTGPPAAVTDHRRTPSRFDWINHVGPSHVLERF